MTIQQPYLAQAPTLRPDWETVGLALALLIAQRSTDPKHRVGCAIISDETRKIASLGYNGRAPGEPEGRESEEVGRSGYLHAEDNAVSGAEWAEGEKHTVFVTHEPCDMCARRLLRHKGRISRVVYLKPYVDPWRLHSGLPRGHDLLEQHGIPAFIVETEAPTKVQALAQTLIRTVELLAQPE